MYNVRGFQLLDTVLLQDNCIHRCLHKLGLASCMFHVHKFIKINNAKKLAHTCKKLASQKSRKWRHQRAEKMWQPPCLYRSVTTFGDNKAPTSKANPPKTTEEAAIINAVQTKGKCFGRKSS